MHLRGFCLGELFWTLDSGNLNRKEKLECIAQHAQCFYP
jgi:hypothetical protein